MKDNNFNETVPIDVIIYQVGFKIRVLHRCKNDKDVDSEFIEKERSHILYLIKFLKESWIINAEEKDHLIELLDEE